MKAEVLVLPEELQQIRENMLSQDNRATSHPMYVVMEDGRDGHRNVIDVFFTDNAARECISENEHNMRNPYVYVKSGYKNREWQAIRKFLRGDDRDN